MFSARNKVALNLTQLVGSPSSMGKAVLSKIARGLSGRLDGAKEKVAIKAATTLGSSPSSDKAPLVKAATTVSGILQGFSRNVNNGYVNDVAAKRGFFGSKVVATPRSAVATSIPAPDVDRDPTVTSTMGLGRRR